MKKTLLFVFASIVLTACSSDPTTSTVTKTISSATFGATGGTTLEIFSDYQCPSCIALDRAIGEKLWDDVIANKKAKVTFYHFPLESIHKNARRDALASLCALSQGQFQGFQKVMYAWENAQKWAITRDSNRNALAAKISGINTVEFAQCLNEGWYLSQVDAELAIGNARDIPGTPTVFLNGVQVNLGSNPQNLLRAIDVANSK